MYEHPVNETTEFYMKMEELGMCGLSLRECGDFFDTIPEDWDTWCDAHPFTVECYNRGKAKGIAFAGQQLLREIKAGKINAIMFYLKTKGNFTEKSVLELNATQKTMYIPPPPIPSDPVEAAKTYNQYMKDS